MWKPAALAPLLLVLAACADGGRAVDDGMQAPSRNATGESAAALEMAVSVTCAGDSSSQCVSINGEDVLITPAEFEQLGVDAAAAAGTGLIDVTLDSDGAAVMQQLSTEASEAGEDARLVTRVGNDVLSAVRVQGAFRGQFLQMAVPAEVDAGRIAARINGA